MHMMYTVKIQCCTDKLRPICAGIENCTQHCHKEERLQRPTVKINLLIYDILNAVYLSAFSTFSHSLSMHTMEILPQRFLI